MFHGKDKPVGSDYIRAIQLIKHWPEAGLYKYGENPDVLIFNKVFTLPDYQFPHNFQNIKILDICDPMWLEGYDVVDTCRAMDAITCPTENLAKFLRQFHNNVVVVPDRFDLSIIPKPKQHAGKAKTVVWFGYSHNAETFKPAMATLEKHGLNLIVISNEEPYIDRWGTRKRDEYYEFIKYNEDTIYEDLHKADFAILPEGFRPQDNFKSNNKTIKANLAGLPVARDLDEVEKYLDGKERQKWLDNNYAKIQEQYDVKQSVKDYKNIISEIRKIRK